MKSDSLVIVRACRKFIYEGASVLTCRKSKNCTTGYHFADEFLSKIHLATLYQNQMSEIISLLAS